MAEKKWSDDVVQDAMTLMAQGKTNPEIAAYLTRQYGTPDKPVPEGTIKRWRAEKFGPAVAKRLDETAQKKLAEETAPPASLPVAPLAETPVPLDVPTQSILDRFPDDEDDRRSLGQLIEDTMRAQLRSNERIARIVSSAEFIGNPQLLQHVDRLADMVKTQGDHAIRILEANARYHAAQQAAQGSAAQASSLT